MSDVVLFEELAAANGKVIGQICLNSEKTLNSLTLEMVDLMTAKLLDWQQNERVSAVFIKGAGEKALCAGGDIQALYRSAIATPGGPCEEAETFFEREYRFDYLLHRYTKPLIVLGHGFVMGGGLGVLAGCNHRVVTEKTRISMPEVSIALFPDVGGSYFLNRMPGQCGRFLALTAASINAADSLYVGLADYFVSHDKLDSVMAELLEINWSGVKAQDDELISEVVRSIQSECIEQLPGANMEACQLEIDSLCDGDIVDDIVDRFKNLETDSKWLSRAKAGIAGGSPLAIKWIFKQLNNSCDMSLEEVFCSELLLVTNIVRHSEFSEGVRALLIDKDKQPQWLISSVTDVEEKHIKPFFKSPWPVNPLVNL